MRARVHELNDLPERLRALPQAASDPEGWRAVERRLALHARRRQRQVRVARFAVAASLVALGLFASLKVLESGSEGPGVAGGAPGPTGPTPAEVQELRDRSRALDELLAALPSRPAVEEAGTSLPIDTLEAQVQWLDHQLSVAGAAGQSDPDAERLWRDRVEVMSSLVRLRYVEAQRIDL